MMLQTLNLLYEVQFLRIKNNNKAAITYKVSYLLRTQTNEVYILEKICPIQGCRSWGCRGAMTPPDFGRSVNPILCRGTDCAHVITTGTPGFSNLPTALLYKINFIITQTLHNITMKNFSVSIVFIKYLLNHTSICQNQYLLLIHISLSLSVAKLSWLFFGAPNSGWRMLSIRKVVIFLQLVIFNNS